MSETARNRLESLHRPRLPARLRHRHRVRHRAAGPGRRRRAADLAQEERARVPHRVAPEGAAPLADDAEPHWAHVQHRADRLPGDLVLLRAEGEDRRPEEPGRGRPEAARDLREARRAAARARAARGRRGRCGVRQRLGRHHVQGAAGGGGRHLLPVLRSGAEASGADRAVSRHRRAVRATTSSPR